MTDQSSIPPLRIWWDGHQVRAVRDISIEEIDGVVERLAKLRRTLSQRVVVLDPPKIIVNINQKG